MDKVEADGNKGRRSPRALPPVALAGAGDSVRRDFEDLGLNNYEARVLVALVRFGPSSAADLARLSGVHRTSVYPVLQELCAKGLAVPLPGRLSQWVSPGRDEVLDALYAYQEERLRRMRGRVERTRQALAELAADEVSAPLPFVHLRSAAQVGRIYEELLAEAEQEVLVFNLPPYSSRPGSIQRPIIEMLTRGVRSRVLYQAAHIQAADAAWRQEHAAYIEAGVQARVVDELPCKLAVVDRKAAILPMTDSVAIDLGYPTTLFIQHSGVAALTADGFERSWETGEDLDITRLLQAENQRSAAI